METYMLSHENIENKSPLKKVHFKQSAQQSIDSLPDELLSDIVKFCLKSDPNDSHAIALVNRQFASIMKNEQLWEALRAHYLTTNAGPVKESLNKLHFGQIYLNNSGFNQIDYSRPDVVENANSEFVHKFLSKFEKIGMLDKKMYDHGDTQKGVESLSTPKKSFFFQYKKQYIGRGKIYPTITPLILAGDIAKAKNEWQLLCENAIEPNKKKCTQAYIKQANYYGVSAEEFIDFSFERIAIFISILYQNPQAIRSVLKANPAFIIERDLCLMAVNHGGDEVVEAILGHRKRIQTGELLYYLVLMDREDLVDLMLTKIKFPFGIGEEFRNSFRFWMMHKNIEIEDFNDLITQSLKNPWGRLKEQFSDMAKMFTYIPFEMHHGAALEQASAISAALFTENTYILERLLSHKNAPCSKNTYFMMQTFIDKHHMPTIQVNGERWSLLEFMNATIKERLQAFNQPATNQCLVQVEAHTKDIKHPKMKALVELSLYYAAIRFNLIPAKKAGLKSLFEHTPMHLQDDMWNVLKSSFKVDLEFKTKKQFENTLLKPLVKSLSKNQLTKEDVAGIMQCFDCQPSADLKSKQVKRNKM